MTTKTEKHKPATDENIEEKLRDFFFTHSNKSFRLEELIDELGLTRRQVQLVKRLLRKLVKRRELVKHKGKRFTAGSRLHVRTGKFEQGKFGAGFVRTEQGDLYIPAGYTSTALPGDMVRVEILAHRTGLNPEARIIEIIKRPKTEFVGTFNKSGKYQFIIPESEGLKRQVVIPTGKTRSAVTGQSVVYRITLWENEYADPIGEIVEVIGFPGEKGIDVLSLARSAGIPIRFSQKALKETDALVKLEGDTLLEGRKDFRSRKVFTIDPESAKDFDDAVSLNRLPDGVLLLGVYIADVTAYVSENSPIDKAAKVRGTSVYLPEKVIHMLPEKLSTDFCSLVPGEDRPVFAICMKCSPSGEVLDYEICEGVIHNKHRFNYKEAQEVIDGAMKSPHRSTLLEMNRFAKTLRKNRMQNGSLDFTVPEIQFEFDESGKPVRLFIKEILDTNNMIEEFMLIANQTAACHIKALQRQHRTVLPFIYRVHDLPDYEDIISFHELARSLGCPPVKESTGTSRWFQKILEHFSDKPEKAFMEEIALRSMMKAVYDSKNIGHFGLGFKDYTHFTSPIRRYPDLVVHRLLKQYNSGKPARDQKFLKRNVHATAQHCSETEKRAMEAEREAVKLKKLEFMTDRIGEVFNGLICGVTSFGIFVKLENILVEGLVHIRDIDDDFYLYDEAAYRLVGQHSNRIFKLGDRVTVQVIKINVERRHLDLILVVN